MTGEVEQRRISVGEVTLNVAAAGPEDGPLVVLLHGFPEFWYAWHRQIGDLARAGFRVFAPDQRGYNTSDKPPRVRDYALDRVAGDVVGLIDAAGRERAYLVGHDWGGAVAWQMAHQFPDRLERMVILNLPHLEVMRRHLRRSLSQLRRSWYILAFQLPWLPERLARRRNWRVLEQAMRRTSHSGTFAEEDFDQYRRAWSQPGAIRSMIHWYRAGLRHQPRWASNRPIQVPTLLIWGAQDAFLGKEMAQPSIEHCRRGRLEILNDATHWLHHEQPEKVNRMILDFFAERDD